MYSRSRNALRVLCVLCTLRRVCAHLSACSPAEADEEDADTRTERETPPPGVRWVDVSMVSRCGPMPEVRACAW